MSIRANRTPLKQQQPGKEPAAAQSRAAPAASGSRQQTQAQQISQLKAKAEAATQRSDGLPAQLRAGMEQLSGADLSGVKVHYNSASPQELAAHAYTQGEDIHLAPGQEQHLAHEAWHVVQQQQGRVRATTQRAGMKVNDEHGLEKEADVMGARAVQLRASGAPVQMKVCKHCGGENAHKKGCTPETRRAADEARESANAAAADQSNDGRSRRDQSHPHHGNKNVKRAWK